MSSYVRLVRASIALTVSAMILLLCATTAYGAESKAKKAKGKKCVVVWSEGTAPKKIYPEDINGAIADGLKSLKGWKVVKASITDPDQGLPDDLLNEADVLIWWGHKRHDAVKDELVAKIVKRVKEDGMGFISLHSAHFAKPNKALMATACSWGAYVSDSTTLSVTVEDANHPIAKDVKDFVIEHSERYSEPYAVPEPEAVPFKGVHTLKDGSPDPSRIGLCWQVGKGKFFYFQAGHETNPVYFDKNVQQIMRNAVEWAAPDTK